MREFVVYLLDRDGALKKSQVVQFDSTEAARDHAHHLLIDFPKVEVREGSVLVYRSGPRKNGR